MTTTLPVTFNYWFLQTVAMMLTAAFLPNFRITGIFGPVLAVVALAFVNATIWDAALFFNIPDSITNQTLTLLGCNALIFWATVKLLPGIEIEGLLAPLLAPIVFTGCSVLVYYYGKDIDWLEVFKSAGSYIADWRDYFLAQQPGTQNAPLPQKTLSAPKL